MQCDIVFHNIMMIFYLSSAFKNILKGASVFFHNILKLFKGRREDFIKNSLEKLAIITVNSDYSYQNKHHAYYYPFQLTKVLYLNYYH